MMMKSMDREALVVLLTKRKSARRIKRRIRRREMRYILMSTISTTTISSLMFLPAAQ
jgi:preprotein translocase subunit SecA